MYASFCLERGWVLERNVCGWRKGILRKFSEFYAGCIIRWNWEEQVHVECYIVMQTESGAGGGTPAKMVRKPAFSRWLHVSWAYFCDLTLLMNISNILDQKKVPLLCLFQYIYIYIFFWNKIYIYIEDAILRQWKETFFFCKWNGICINVLFVTVI